MKKFNDQITDFLNESTNIMRELEALVRALDYSGSEKLADKLHVIKTRQLNAVEKLEEDWHNDVHTKFISHVQANAENINAMIESANKCT